jgi:16S rRNA (guanine966-N2)-methyltransferase
MRILAGAWAGTPLTSPGSRVRPTSEALRGRWLDWLREDLPEARVLDLFSGSGALGLEALSRGAASVDFVEVGADALHALKANRAALGVTKRTRLFKKDAFRFLEGAGHLAYDLTFADPPYTSRSAENLVGLWAHRPFSRVLSVEHAREIVLPPGGVRRVFEDSAVTFYRTRAERGGA